MKKIKLMSLESKFENFNIQEGESIENMYSRLMHILNEFDEVGESLSNSKIVGKIFRAMIRRPRWESMISTLETMQGTLGEFTNEEVFVRFWSNQIMLRLKLRKDRKIKILFLLKIEIKIYQMITERYIYFNPL
jgi:gag-polypeptide of LTR copia-type